MCRPKNRVVGVSWICCCATGGREVPCGRTGGPQCPHPNPRLFACMQLCGSDGPDPVDSGGFLTLAGTEVNRCGNPRSHPRRPAFIQLRQVVQVRGFLDDIIHLQMDNTGELERSDSKVLCIKTAPIVRRDKCLLCDAHSPVGVHVSSLQLRLHSFPNTHSVRVSLLHSFKKGGGKKVFIYLFISINVRTECTGY